MQHVINDLVAHLLQTIDRDPSVAPSFSRLPDSEHVWQSLLFCILSSQVRVSSAAKAARAVLTDVPFFRDVASGSEVYQSTKETLTRVRYRFPEVRSRQIAGSWFAFAQVKDCLYDYLDSFKSEGDARQAMMQLFPGVGLKQASMFLRDIGYADRLCIVDTHLLWYCGQMGQDLRGALTEKRYMEVEDFLLRQSDQLGVSPKVLDSAIWVAVTTFKAKQCTMQFA